MGARLRRLSAGDCENSPESRPLLPARRHADRALHAQKAIRPSPVTALPCPDHITAHCQKRCWEAPDSPALKRERLRELPISSPAISTPSAPSLTHPTQPLDSKKPWRSLDDRPTANKCFHHFSKYFSPPLPLRLDRFLPPPLLSHLRRRRWRGGPKADPAQPPAQTRAEATTQNATTNAHTLRPGTHHPGRPS